MSVTFETLGLRPELERVVLELGYEQPTPIQANAIPALLAGRDVIGQAQTGTGKTAAFALPMLHSLDLDTRAVQALVLTPTRELALQVSEAIQQYGQHLKIRVLPIYGGQSYARQMRALERGVPVVVGTPGRIIDLIEREALDLSGVRYLVLDEADEMLKMGFVEDVERILSETPAERQTALFSATMPEPIRRLADRYLREPFNVTIAAQSLTVAQTEQRYYLVHQESKLAALARIIEVEDVTSALIFARTKVGTAELAEALLARGFPAEALHGDLSQDVREVVMRRFRNGQIVFLVATDVAARGLDIENVSHVINYDMPFDAEDYVHRIGRTGRAGREGIAISLVTPRERRWLYAIEQFTRQRINRAALPTAHDVQARRDERFLAAVAAQLDTETLNDERALVHTLAQAGYAPEEIAAAAIRMARAAELKRPIEDVYEVQERSERPARRERAGEAAKWRDERRPHQVEAGMVRLLLDVGREHGIRPGDIVGAIAGEAGIPGKSIGAIDIQKARTFVDVREQHAERVLNRTARGFFLRGNRATLTLANARTGGTEARPRARQPHFA